MTYEAGDYSTGAWAMAFMTPGGDRLHIVLHPTITEGRVLHGIGEMTVETDLDGRPSGVVLARGEQTDDVSLAPVYPYTLQLTWTADGEPQIMLGKVPP